MLTQQHFERRRKKIFSQMKNDSIGFLFAAPEYDRTPGISFPYRQDSDFYYATGFLEPRAIAVFIKTKNHHEYILFNAPYDAKKEKWQGKQAGQKDAVNLYQANQSFSIDTFYQKLPELLKNKKVLYYPFHHPSSSEKLLKPASLPSKIVNFDQILHPLRLVKTATEIELMQKASHITADAIRRSMQISHAGIYEYQLEAEMVRNFIKHGAKFSAFPTIIASGSNACTLHYDSNSGVLQQGDLVLIDAGCEYEYYAADISRTFPINGKFNDAQRALYQLVLNVQMEIIDSVKPETTLKTLQLKAIKLIDNGLKSLGILNNNNDCQDFYFHNIGHFVGLDAHDVGGSEVPLKEGMIITVEPGIYISKEDKTVDKKWRGIGIRIEDEILVTAAKPYVLTDKVPKTIDAIEKLMK